MHYHSFGFKYFSSRNHISWCCFNSIPLLGLRNLMPHLSGTHRLPPSLGCLLDVNLHHFSVTVPTSYRLKFTNIRRENFWIQIFISLRFLDLELIWLLTWCKSAPLFSNCPDFLQIEIYYNKKHLFLENLFSRTTAVDFWILDLDFWSSRSRFLSPDLWSRLDFWILISGSLWSRFDFQILSKYNS